MCLSVEVKDALQSILEEATPTYGLVQTSPKTTKRIAMASNLILDKTNIGSTRFRTLDILVILF